MYLEATRSVEPIESAVKELEQTVQRAEEAVEQERQAKEFRLSELQKRLYGFYQDEQERQRHNRYHMALDHDYFDSLQRTEEEVRELLARGQAPTVHNILKPTALWVLGTERRARMDYKIYPREKGDDNDAEVKTQFMKYHDDVMREKYHRSRAFTEAVISGLGWMECQASSDPTDEPVITRSESWRNVHYDSCGQELDTKDWRYIFRERIVDMDIACRMFPGHKEALERSAFDAGTETEPMFFLHDRVDSVDYPSAYEMSRYRMNDAFAPYRTKRKRVKLIEAWYRVPEECAVCVGGTVHGAPVNENDPFMKFMQQSNALNTHTKFTMRMRVAMMTEKFILSDDYSPYRHNSFPFTPIWGYRRGRDNMPYGLIRELRDPQDDFNKRMSKATHRINANQIHAEDNASDDWDRVRREAAKPDGVVLRKKGTLLEIRTEDARAQGDLEMLNLHLQMVRDIGGVNSDNLGLQSNAQSGKAVIARQEQGSLLTQVFFDNLRMGIQIHGEKKLSMLEQYYTEERVFRVTGEKDFEWQTLNEPEVDATGEVRYLNDMTATKADFIVDEQDYRATIRQSMAEVMADMMGRVDATFAQEILPSWIELLDIPDKDKVLRAVKARLGMLDDDDPASRAIREAQDQAQQQVQEIEAQYADKVQKLTEQNSVLRQKLAGKQGELELGWAELDFDYTKMDNETFNKHLDVMSRERTNRENNQTRSRTAMTAAAMRKPQPGAMHG